MSTTGSRPSHATSAQASIPFREDTSEGASGLVDVLLVLALMLGALLALAITAQRKGLLKRWAIASPIRPAGAGLLVEESLRLSSRTTLYRISDGTRTHLLIESTATTRFVTLRTEEPADDAR